MKIRLELTVKNTLRDMRKVASTGSMKTESMKKRYIPIL